MSSVPPIDEEQIRRLVHSFYATVRADPLLGPIFNSKVEDWDVHLAKLCDFWSNVVLKTGRYDGNPMRAHVGLPIEDTHFLRWLDLFRAAARRECPPEAAEHFIDFAQRIARSLSMGIDWHRQTLKAARP
jgi:hemoglobin